RGTRTLSDTDFQAVTPDGRHKTRFVIVDAVGVCESDKGDSRPLDRKPSVSFRTLLTEIAMGVRDEDTLTSLASRLARLDREIGPEEREQIAQASGGATLKEVVNRLLDAVDPDVQARRAQEQSAGAPPGEAEQRQAAEALAAEACAPFDSPRLRETLLEIKQRSEQIIDTVSQDAVLSAGYDEQAKARARTIVDTFRRFIEENKDELTALQLIYSRPYGQRRLTYEAIKELAQAVEKPPYLLTPEAVWQAYEQLDRARVRGAGPQKLLTNLISLIRFAVGESDVLEPYPDTVSARFDEWLAAQEALGRTFTPEQMEWLLMIRDHIATSLRIEVADLDLAPFYERGGPLRAYQVFGEAFDGVLQELNEALAA
ncbi:MAG: restriction endonuclease subunit R, partial [Anaerolineae bacterium]|nr:restriction endonuclease subunit R [Anaerolineae bacterium]